MGDPSPQSNVRGFPSPLYSRSTFGSMGVSTPNGSFGSNGFGKSDSLVYGADRHAMERSSAGPMPSLSASTSDPATFSQEGRFGAILIRRLPRGISSDSLGSMLIFAGDLIDTQIVRSPFSEDAGFVAAVARFRSEAGALEAQQKLHGKPNTTKEANMIVEVQSSMVGCFERRNTIDGAASRTQNNSASSAGSIGGPPSSRSRYGGSFQSDNKVSPPVATPGSGGSGEFPIPETSTHFQNLFSPHSPLANGVHDHRVSGKSMINDDLADDETSELLKDPAAYARNGQQSFSSRGANVIASRFGSLSLSTGNGNAGSLSSPPVGMTSPRNAGSMQSPISAISPTGIDHTGSNGSFSTNNPRPQYPPVNPADQNPPCNTLYVGNLPIDTSEDELKTIFSRQRGYKRLVFRTKGNGPMCFVEFEDIGFATRALHELYGHPLHNSVKGGIRLSFSKNPLGVRAGQAGGPVSGSMMSMQNGPPGYGGMVTGHNFSSVSGPPPGLVTPPGLVPSNGYRQAPTPSMDSMFANPFGMPSQEFADQLGSRTTLSGGVPPQIGNGSFSSNGRNGRSNPRDSGNGYPDYFGDGRNAYSGSSVEVRIGHSEYPREGQSTFTDRSMGR